MGGGNDGEHTARSYKDVGSATAEEGQAAGCTHCSSTTWLISRCMEKGGMTEGDKEKSKLLHQTKGKHCPHCTHIAHQSEHSEGHCF